jgi:hypothetical protein
MKGLKNGSIEGFISSLAHGCPMLEYEALYKLFASLGVRNKPTMHWSNFVGCIFLEIMHIQIKNAIVKAI